MRFAGKPRALPHCHLVKASKDADREFRGAHASRVLVEPALSLEGASRRNELSETHEPGKSSAPEEPARRSAGRGAFAKANPEKSSSSRDATTNPRDACAPRSAPLRHPQSVRLTKWQWGVALGWLAAGLWPSIRTFGLKGIGRAPRPPPIPRPPCPAC